MDNFRITSYNCRGLPSEADKIKFKPSIENIFNDQTVSIICYQETFYTKQDLAFLNNLDPKFHGVGTATVDGKSRLLKSHAPGGVAIFWRTKFDSIVNPLTFEYDWIVGLELKFGNKKCVILNIYMPCESTDEHEEQYLRNLGIIACILRYSC